MTDQLQDRDEMRGKWVPLRPGVRVPAVERGAEVGRSDEKFEKHADPRHVADHHPGLTQTHPARLAVQTTRPFFPSSLGRGGIRVTVIGYGGVTYRDGRN